MPARTWFVRSVAVALAGVAGAAYAQQFSTPTGQPAATATSLPQLNYTLELGIEHSDNINLSGTDPVSQNVLIPRLTFDYLQDGSTIQAHVVGQVEYRDYLQGAFDNEFRGQLAGAVNWVIAPQRLAFSAEDSSSVAPVNPFATNAPSNLQQVNVFSAGPTLLFRLGSTLRGQAELRYIDSIASKTKFFDSQRGFGALRIADDLSATDQLSGNLELQHADFTNPEVTSGLRISNYYNYNLYSRYQSKLAHLDLDAALGWSRYAFDGVASNQSGILARVRLTWLATPRSTFGLDGARQFTDASQLLLADPNLIGISVDPTNIRSGNSFITPQVYLENRVDADYTFHGDRFGLRVAPYYLHAHYPNEPGLDNTGPGGVISLSYRLRPLLTIGFSAFDSRLRYRTLNRLDKIYGFGPYLTDRLTAHWSWRLQFTHDRRASTAAGESFTDNVALAIVSYSR